MTVHVGEKHWHEFNTLVVLSTIENVNFVNVLMTDLSYILKKHGLSAKDTPGLQVLKFDLPDWPRLNDVANVIITSREIEDKIRPDLETFGCVPFFDIDEPFGYSLSENQFFVNMTPQEIVEHISQRDGPGHEIALADEKHELNFVREMSKGFIMSTWEEENPTWTIEYKNKQQGKEWFWVRIKN